MRLFLGAALLQAREAGELFTQEVDALSARLAGSASTGLDSAHRLAKEAGVVSDVRAPVTMYMLVQEELLTSCCLSDRLLTTPTSPSGSGGNCSYT